jgi:hypothetical protein
MHLFHGNLPSDAYLTLAFTSVQLSLLTAFNIQGLREDFFRVPTP